MPTPEHKARVLNAIILVTGGYFAFSGADIVAKFLRGSFTAHDILAVGGFIGLVISFTLVMIKKGWRGFCPPKLAWVILRGLLTCGTSYLAVTAFKLIPLTDFYGVVFLSPFFVLILAHFLLKEQVGWRRWAATAVAFTGVMIMAAPQFDKFGLGYIFAFLCAVTAAGNIIIIRKIGPVDFPPVYAFYPMLFIFLFNAGYLAWTGGDGMISRITPDNIWLFALHAPLVVAGILMTSHGFATSPETSIVAPFHYTQIIWGTAFGYFLFAEIPTPATVAGLTLIVGAGLYSIYRDYWRKHHRAEII